MSNSPEIAEPLSANRVGSGYNTGWCHMLAPNDRRSFKSIVMPAIALLAALTIAAAIWTYTTRDWNASGTQKAGSPSGSTPSEGGKPLMLNK
jgi:hypothetical protein